MMQIETDKLKEAFDVIADSETDNISRDDLKRLLGDTYGDDNQLENIGNEITFEEFKSLFRKERREVANSLAGSVIVP